jgi:2-polyprenyl-6-methoxyphenol hydroxylase-like FAD-dependent oxidoreductase
MTKEYDAIVVGARCAGSPTAMLLARRGYSVLLLDKATFPSDTMSTHFIHAPGVAALARWGLLDQLEATGCPPVMTYSYDFGPFSIAGSPRPADGEARGFGPRRTVLDALLVEAAAEAGAEVREDFTVEGVVMEDGRVIGIRGHARGGSTVTERAKIVIGADGKHSGVAKAVDAAKYNELPKRSAAYYSYWSDLPTQDFETHIRAEHSRGWGVLPTHDDLTCVVVGWPVAQFAANKRDVEGNYMRTFDLAPEFAERVRSATRESRIVGTGDQPNHFREPFGPGWALVGDAGYHKDAITAMGINDAFRDAEGLAAALDDSLAGRRPYDEAMVGYQRARDEAALPVFGLTCDFARIEPPPPEMGQLLAAVSQSQEAMDGFASVMATTLPAPEFFGPQNAGRIMAAAG